MLQKIDKKIPARVLIITYLTFTALSYIILNIGFKPELYDNAWTHYWTWDFFTNGVVEDRLRGDGLANLRVTGITPAFIYGHIMNIIGWELPKTLLISTSLIFSGLTFWALFLKDRGWSRLGIFVFVTMGLLLDVFFEPAHTSKSDAFTFFSLSLAFYLFSKRRYLFAGLAAVVCVEGHPIGIVSFIYMLAYFLGNRESILKEHKIRPFLFFAGGMALGVGYYFLLHYNSLFHSDFSLNSNLKTNEHQFYFMSYIYKYFFSGKMGRHIPELLILAAGWIIGFRKGFHKKAPDLYWILALIIITSFANPRPVHTYVVVAFPALALATVDAAERLKLQKVLLLAFFILMLPQYLFIFKESRTWPPHQEYVETTRSNLPEDKSIPVLGSPREWFACVNERPFYDPNRLVLAPDFRPATLYLVVEDQGRKDEVKELNTDEYDYTMLYSFDNHGELFELYRMDLKPQ